MLDELKRVTNEIQKAIVGKEEAIEKVLIAVLAGGHILLDDVPGVGKTTLAVALSRALGLSYSRIQFTPDVLPSDIVGYSVYQKETGALEYRPGILLGANLILADEINRTSSKTQSALLEAMGEKQVTVDGNTYPLRDPFIVIATQNNVGTAGTQLLPYAQIDRFMVRLSLGYPDYAAQMEILRSRREADPLLSVSPVLSKEDVLRLQGAVRRVRSEEPISDYITRLVLASRNHPLTQIGISPRGALFVDRCARARALAEGRDFVIGEDVQSVFSDVCAHRILLNQKARLAGESAEGVAEDLLKSVTVPDRSFSA